MTALFIIFLGIIPALAIVGFLFYYTKHNIRLSWKQSSLVYVIFQSCSCFRNALTACKGVGDKQAIPTVSKRVSKSLRNLEVKQTGLVFTTNRQIINNSSTLVDLNENSDISNRNARKSRFSWRNLKGLKLNINAVSLETSKNPMDTPGTSETICSHYDTPTSVKYSVNEFRGG